MGVRSTLHVLALIIGLAVLFVVLVFGAIVVLVYRDRLAGFSYFAGGMTTSKSRMKIDQDI